MVGSAAVVIVRTTVENSELVQYPDMRSTVETFKRLNSFVHEYTVALRMQLT